MPLIYTIQRRQVRSFKKQKLLGRDPRSLFRANGSLVAKQFPFLSGRKQYGDSMKRLRRICKRNGRRPIAFPKLKSFLVPVNEFRLPAFDTVAEI